MRAPTWIEIDVDRSGDEIRVTARGARNERLTPRPFARGAAAMLRFAEAVQRAASCGKALPADLLAESRAIHEALLGGDIAPSLARLREAAQGPLLVRLAIHDPELQGVPWEALCKSREALGF